MAMQDMSTRVRKYVKALRESQILFRKYFGPRPEYRNKFEDEKVLQKVEKAVFSVVDVQKDQENIYLVVKSKDKQYDIKLGRIHYCDCHQRSERHI
eukprot:953381_1